MSSHSIHIKPDFFLMCSMLGIEYEPIGVMDSVEFPAGMTPLIMAGHCNSFELIKLLMDRGHTMAIPHRADCKYKTYKSLKV